VRDAVTQCSSTLNTPSLPGSSSQHFVGSPAFLAPRNKARKNHGKTSLAAAPLSVEFCRQVRIRNVITGVLAELLQ
jgi:hypothetical protein